MERRDEEAPFPREPWQRLLGDADDGPPETTDARICAAARRDLAPRGRRWWLPASLAASFVLAVMIVQSEFGTIRRPVMTESAATGDSAIDARLIERGAGPEAREAGKSPDAAASMAKRAREQAEPDAYGYLDPSTGTEDAGVGPRVGGPEHEIQAASELPGEAAAELDAVTPHAAKTDLPPPPRAEAASPAEGITDAPLERSANLTSSAMPVPASPESWYTQIRKMFAEGRREEAERELAALRKAYPDWAAKHVKAEDLR